MANKNFGIKQLILVGESGTPTIESPDNLNLTANVVAISTDMSIGGQIQSNLRIGSSYSVGIGTTNPTSKLHVVGVVSATSFSGSASGLTSIPAGNLTGALPAIDGSSLTGIVGSGSGIVVKDSGTTVGTAGTIDFGDNLNVSAISAGIVTVTGSASGGGSSQFVTTAAGIHTLSNVGVGTTNPTEKLTVVGVTSSSSFYGDASYTVSGRWTLGADGTSNYTFVGIGFTQTTNDPVLYLARGRVYEFVNNSGGSHPFQIRVSNGGAAYSDGVTNNGGASGVIRFEIPFSAPNTLYYQCTSHSGMGATIFVTPRNEPAVGVRTTVTATTSSIGAGSTSDLDIGGFKTYSLLKVGISSAAWVVLYTDSTSRSNDASRSYLTDPTPGSGVIAEVRTVSSGISTFIMSPGVIGWNNDVSVSNTIYAKVTNNESSTSAGIGVTLTVVKLED